MKLQFGEVRTSKSGRTKYVLTAFTVSKGGCGIQARVYARKRGPFLVAIKGGEAKRLTRKLFKAA